jgi:hypothetical protein
MEMPKPGDAHRKLRLLLGEWIGEEQLHPSPWDRMGGVATGKVINRLALDGFAVIQEYLQERTGRNNFIGHGIFTWNESEHCYELWWFDSMGMPPSHFRGAFDDDILTLTSKNSQGQMRAVFDFSKGSTYRYTMEVSSDGSQWSPFMDGRYARKKG